MLSWPPLQQRQQPCLCNLPREEHAVTERLCNAKRIVVAACGTSWHSGWIAKFTIETLAGTLVEVEHAGEFRYRRPILCRGDVLVAIPQSGETVDTLEAIRIGAVLFDALTIGVMNGVGSSIARLTDAGVYLHIGVASTKAVKGQVIAFLMIALKVARQRNTLSFEDVSQHCEALNSVPDLVKDWLAPPIKQIKAIAKCLRLATNVKGAPWSQVTACALEVVEGACGVVFMFQDDPDLLIRARKGSPLLLGVGDEENMLADDGSAVVEHTRDVAYVRDGERVVVRRDSYQTCLASEHALCGDHSLTPEHSCLGVSDLISAPFEKLPHSNEPAFAAREVVEGD
jgi:glucosamine 6-phosphate synthetase-like amidotransferase/phosphosugar isomerase protein